VALEDEIITFEGPVVKPLSYFEQMIRMPNNADKFDLRLRAASARDRPEE
jgi:hypothetical protein